MMRNYFCLIVFLVFSIAVKSQERISNIINTEEAFFVQRNIAMVGNDEYLIEQNPEITKISRLDLNQVEHLYTLSHRPQNENKLYISDPCLLSFPLMYDQNQLIEIYTNSIYLTDIHTGKLLKSIHINNDSLQIVSKDGLMLGKSLVLLARYTSNKNKIILVDLETFKMSETTRFFGNKIHRIDEFIYEYNGPYITRYSLLNQVTDTLITSDDVFNFIGSFTRDCQNHLIFGTDEGSVYHSDPGHQITKLGCKINKELYEVLIKDSIMLVSFLEGTSYKSDIIDLTNCEILYHSRLLIAYDIPEFNSHKLLLSKIGGPFDSGIHLVFETTTHKLDTLDMSSDVDYFYGKRRYYNDGKLFIVGFNDSETGFEPATMWVIDDHDLSTVRVLLPVDYIPTNIFFNRSVDGTLKIITERIVRNADFLTLTIRDTTANHITSLIHRRNEGIEDIFIHKSDVFISGKGGIYHIQNGVFSNMFSCINSSRFAVYNNYIYTLCRVDENELGYVRINLSDYSVQFFAIEGLSSINIIGIAEYGFFIGADSMNTELTFFDLKSESFQSISFNNKNLNPFSVHASGQFLLFKAGFNSETHLFILNTAANTIQIVALNESQIGSIYPEKNGNFFLTRLQNDRLEVLKLTNQGLVEIIESFENFNGCSDGSHNEVTTFYISTNDEVVFFSVKEDVIEKNHIPHVGLHHTDCDLYWKSKNDLVLVESGSEDGVYSLHLWKFGDTPVKIPLPIIDYRITEAMFDKEDIIIIFHSKVHSTSFIMHYNYTSKSIIDIQEFPSTKGSDVIDYTKLTENIFILSYNNGTEGSELWIYNKTTHVFELLKDIFSGELSSNPANFICLDDNVYFTAVDTDKSRQWFRYKTESSGLGPLSDLSGPLTVVPNPSANFIQLMLNETIDQNNYFISIYNIQGMLIYVENRTLSEVIDISHFPSGIYYIFCSDGVSVLNTRLLKMY